MTGLPSVAEKTASMDRIDGFFPLYWEDSMGRLWMEVQASRQEFLFLSGIATGLGSNDIGLDRGAGTRHRIVRMERVGRKVLMIQPNYRFRALSENPEEVRAVVESFAPSVLWGFELAAASGDRLLVELTPFLLRDSENWEARLSPGTYRFDLQRSAPYMPMTMGFPKNTEVEVSLTFVRQPGDRARDGSGRDSFEGVADVAASPDAVTLRLHHSFVELPDQEYRPRRFDPRAGFNSTSFVDYSAPLTESLTTRFINRHRLKKVDPRAASSDAVEPIVYYLDPGVPEPVRSALLDGARWWNQAFEAAGYHDAFRVELRPPDISPHDVRYNVINWAHRSTRGWSYGRSITDPRTGEIIKGEVTLGSLRVRQDYLIAEGLLAPYGTGHEEAPELTLWALARIRQLSAHEVGHTLGLAHNYYNSSHGRISVLDYPHPLVTLNDDGSLDYSSVYATGIGEWDKVAVAYGYQDFPEGADEEPLLRQILSAAWESDLHFLSNQDIDLSPRADQWANGTDPTVELRRVMDIRRAGLARFGEAVIRNGRPLAELEEALVPLFLHHRYQVDSTASALGGIHYSYALRGDGRPPFERVSAGEQYDALDALLDTLLPAELTLPESIVGLIPPRPPGFPRTRELFPGQTGLMFDTIAPARVAAEHTISRLLEEPRAARLVEQHALDPKLPGIQDVVDRLFESVFTELQDVNPYQAEVQRAIQHVALDNMMRLAASPSAIPQVRAIVMDRLKQSVEGFHSLAVAADQGMAAHYRALASNVEIFLRDPLKFHLPPKPVVPPGAPIGEPAWNRP